MASGWDEHKAELERLYLREQPSKTLLQIKAIMQNTHGFKRSEKSYERKFKEWGFRKNLNSSHSREINRLVKIRKASGKESRVLIHGSLLDLDNPKTKRKISRNAPLLSTSFPQNSNHHSGTAVGVEETPYVYTPLAESSTPTYFLKDLPWFKFRILLPSDASLYPDLAVIASQMAEQSKHAASASGSLVQVNLTSNTVLSTSIFSGHPGQLRLHGQTSLAKRTRNCHEYLRTLVPEEADKVSTMWNETSSGTMQFMSGTSTPHFSLLVYLASNNLLEHAALDSMVDYAEDLIRRRQFKSVFSAPEPTIRALLDTLLASAVRTMNTSVIKAALSAGAYPNVHVENSPALIWVAAKDDTEVMKLLLDSGADLHATDHYSWETALFRATEYEGVNAVKLLLEVGGTSKVEAEQALDKAIEKSNTKICRLILDADTGLDVNRPTGVFTYSGFTRSVRSFLQKAVLGECTEIVELLLNRGADLNAPADPQNGITALQAAVSRGNIAITRDLLHLGADVNQEASKRGKTAIQHAMEQHSEELVILLLEAGADINAPAAPKCGSTALQSAAKNADVGLIKLLLERGADVNAPAAPFVGLTALQAAAGAGRREVVELLLDYGADVNAPASPRYGTTALRAATRSGDIVMAKLLLDHGADVDASAALHEAAINGDIVMAKLLLDYGADILAPDPEGGASVFELAVAYDELDLSKTPLFGYREAFEVVERAWYRRDFPFVHMMLELSAGIDVRSLCSGNALGMAAKRSHDTNIDLVEFLLEIGAAVDSREGDDSPTALHLAVLHHDFPVVQTLLKAGADIHLLWDEKSIIETAIEHQLSRSIIDARIIVDVIVDAWTLFEKADYVSPDLNLFEFQGDQFRRILYEENLHLLLSSIGEELTTESKKRAEGALAVAAGQWLQHSAKLIRILLDAGADPNIRGEEAHTPLQRVAHLGSAPLVRSLLNANADVNAPPRQVVLHRRFGYNYEAWTALQASIMTDFFDLEIVHLLLDRGADINAPAPQGIGTRTALQAAIESGNSIELIQLLLDRGADFNAPAGPERGVTALQAAAIKGYVGLAAQLLKAGAKVNAPGSPVEGRTALEGAAERGRLDMVKLLLNAGAGYDEFGVLSYETALSYAKGEGHMAVHNLIKDHFDKLKSDESSADCGVSNTLWDPDISRWNNGVWEWEER